MNNNIVQSIPNICTLFSTENFHLYYKNEGNYEFVRTSELFKQRLSSRIV